MLRIARRYLPIAAPGATTDLARIVDRLGRTTWPEVAWSFSRLNGDGYPVEFVFGTAADNVRFTAEVAEPGMPEDARLYEAWAWAEKGPPPATVRNMQNSAARSLRWGAWVSGAYREVGHCRRKIYIETPESVLQAAKLPTPPGSRLRFIGLSQGGAEVEYYFRKDKIGLAAVGSMLRALGWSDLYAPLRDLVHEIVPRKFDDRLLPTDAGFSISPSRGFTLYTFARSLWGSDRAIRCHLLDFAARKGWDFRFYEDVTQPLEAATDFRTAHGLLAWICAPGHPIELRVGVRPPQALAAAT